MSKDPVEAYTRARKLLKTRFGDDYVISEAMVKKIVHGPEIKNNNADAIQDFTDSVRDCVETLRSMDRLASRHTLKISRARETFAGATAEQMEEESCTRPR